MLSLLYGFHSSEGNGDRIKGTLTMLKLGTYALPELTHVSHESHLQSFIPYHSFTLVTISFWGVKPIL